MTGSVEPRAAQLSLPGRPKPYVLAHRGNKFRYPENTMTAFRQAIDDGADMIETDIHMTRDGHFVCIHDKTVDRTTNGTGQVAEMELSELQQLNAAHKDTNLQPEPVPTLEDFASLFPEDVGLALELKSDDFLDSKIAARLTGHLEDLGVSDRTIILSFNFERLSTIRGVAPRIPLGWITIKRPWLHDGVEMLGPYWPLLLFNPFYVSRAHKKGQLVCPLDPTPEPRLGIYLRLGVDAVLSDNPAITCKALSRSRSIPGG